MYTVEKVKVAFNSFFLPTPNHCLPNTRGKGENNKGSLDIWYLHTNITWKKFDAIVCKKWTWSQLLKRSINNLAASTPLHIILSLYHIELIGMAVVQMQNYLWNNRKSALKLKKSVAHDFSEKKNQMLGILKTHIHTQKPICYYPWNIQYPQKLRAYWLGLSSLSPSC